MHRGGPRQAHHEGSNSSALDTAKPTYDDHSKADNDHADT